MIWNILFRHLPLKKRLFSEFEVLFAQLSRLSLLSESNALEARFEDFAHAYAGTPIDNAVFSCRREHFLFLNLYALTNLLSLLKPTKV